MPIDLEILLNKLKEDTPKVGGIKTTFFDIEAVKQQLRELECYSNFRSVIFLSKEDDILNIFNLLEYYGFCEKKIIERIFNNADYFFPKLLHLIQEQTTGDKRAMLNQLLSSSEMAATSQEIGRPNIMIPERIAALMRDIEKYCDTPCYLVGSFLLKLLDYPAAIQWDQINDIDLVIGVGLQKCGFLFENHEGFHNEISNCISFTLPLSPTEKVRIEVSYGHTLHARDLPKDECARALRIDSAGRDFTCTALYSTADGVILDPLKRGQQDWENHNLRLISGLRDLQQKPFHFVRFWYYLAKNMDLKPDPESLETMRAFADMCKSYIPFIEFKRLGAFFYHLSSDKKTKLLGWLRHTESELLTCFLQILKHSYDNTEPSVLYMNPGYYKVFKKMYGIIEEMLLSRGMSIGTIDFDDLRLQSPYFSGQDYAHMGQNPFGMFGTPPPMMLNLYDCTVYNGCTIYNGCTVNHPAYPEASDTATSSTGYTFARNPFPFQ